MKPHDIRPGGLDVTTGLNQREPLLQAGSARLVLVGHKPVGSPGTGLPVVCEARRFIAVCLEGLARS